jgi:hypothetical protein
MKQRTDNDYFYDSWKKMHVRCYDSSYHSFHRYGGRGIQVCPRWHTYQLFKLDMYGDWERGLTLDRINNDGHYEPGNVRWLPASENKKSKKYDVAAINAAWVAGKTQRQIADELGTSQGYVARMLKREGYA